MPLLVPPVVPELVPVVPPLVLVPPLLVLVPELVDVVPELVLLLEGVPVIRPLLEEPSSPHPALAARMSRATSPVEREAL